MARRGHRRKKPVNIAKTAWKARIPGDAGLSRWKSISGSSAFLKVLDRCKLVFEASELFIGFVERILRIRQMTTERYQRRL